MLGATATIVEVHRRRRRAQPRPPGALTPVLVWLDDHAPEDFASELDAFCAASAAVARRLDELNNVLGSYA